MWRLPRGESEFVTVVIPEQFKRQSSVGAGRTSFRLKLSCSRSPAIVITDVPVVTARRTPEGHTPQKLVVRVLLANVHAGALRALSYAQALGVEDLRAVSFAIGEGDAVSFRQEWERAGLPCHSTLVTLPIATSGRRSAHTSAHSPPTRTSSSTS